MDCSLPGSSIHGIFQAGVLEWVAISFWLEWLFQGIFPTQGSSPGLLNCRQILYQLSHQGSPRILELVAYPFFRGSYQPRNQTGVSCIADGLFTSWATREVVYTYIEGNSNPLQYSCLENPCGQRSLAGYSQWAHKESDMTEQLKLSIYLSIVYIHIYI